ncbi:major facilitator superfamily domain-containing protein [Lipomyces japonicus]|uniref:major facilitator superfamily domain-containing protein n=1 Tax=Lipomyces japonicus TaxID=56871 RepID=UPI0034CD39DF
MATSSPVKALSRFRIKHNHHRHAEPLFLKARTSNLIIISTVGIAVFTDIFIYGVIIPIAPFALVQRMGVSSDVVQQNISIAIFVYAAGLLISSPAVGWLADIYQQRRGFMMGGLIALLGSTVMLMLARTYWVFVVGRLVQGISSGVVWTVGCALLIDSVPAQDVGKALGLISSCMNLGTFLGPLLGGVIYARAGYYAVFGVVFAIIGIDLTLRVFMLEKKEWYKWHPDDQEPASVAVTDVGDGDNKKKEKKTSTGVILLKEYRIINGLFLVTLCGWILTGLETTLPIHVEDLFEFNSLGAGLIFLPIALTSLIAPLIGWWVDRKGSRLPLALGFLLSCPFLVLLRLPNHNAVSQVVLMCAMLALLGICISALLPAAMAEISKSVETVEQRTPGIFGKGGANGQAFGLLNMAFSAGSVFGPLEAGFVANQHGFNTASWTLGLIGGVASIPAFLFVGGVVKRGKKKNLAGNQQSAASALNQAHDEIEL